MKQEDQRALAGMSVPKPARATSRRTLAATLIILLLVAYLIKMGSGEVHTHPVKVANDGDVLPQEYRRFLNRVFGPVRWLGKTAWKSSIDFCEHHTEPKNAFGVRLHFNPDYKF